MTHPSDDPNPPADKPCSSPPCYAAEFPGYFGDGPPPAVVDGLNALLEAERAGARVLAILRDSLDAHSPLHDLLGALQKDEGANAVQLYQTLRRLGGAASHETGAFVGKTKNEGGKGVMVDYRYLDGAAFQPSDEEVKKLRPAN